MMNQIIENLVPSCEVDTALDAGYKAMAEDQEREVEALAWCNGLTRSLRQIRRD